MLKRGCFMLSNGDAEKKSCTPAVPQRFDEKSGDTAVKKLTVVD
jgi:hypothetical protein